MKLPTPYRGQDVYDDFEVWDYEVDQWLEDTGYKGQKAVRYVGGFLKDKAARWFMDFVAPEPEKYTVDTLKIALFAYCFPLDLKSKLRRGFKYARQGSSKFQDYVRMLKRLQRRIPDITDQQMCIKLWETVHTYIKVEWTDAGMDSEETELETLCEAALRFKASEEIRTRYNQKTNAQATRKDEGWQNHAPNKDPKNQDGQLSSMPKTQNKKEKGQKPHSSQGKTEKLTREELL